MATYSDSEQRELDQKTGRELDRRAGREMTPLKRAAKAIADNHAWADARFAAHAALVAIEEPSEAMIEAGLASLGLASSPIGLTTAHHLRLAWRAMHKAMMDETK